MCFIIIKMFGIIPKASEFNIFDKKFIIVSYLQGERSSKAAMWAGGRAAPGFAC